MSAHAHKPEQYETAVPEAFEAVRTMCEDWAEHVRDEVQGITGVYHATVEEVENRHVPGFIPWTDGGFQVWGYASLSGVWGTGEVPAVIKPYLDQSEKDCREQWMKDHEGQDPWEYDEDNPLRDEFFEFEMGWHQDGGTYFYKARALFYSADNPRNDTGEDEVYFDAYINTDFEYGRDNIAWAGGDQTAGNWKRTVKVRDLTPELIETLKREAVEVLRSL